VAGKPEGEGRGKRLEGGEQGKGGGGSELGAEALVGEQELGDELLEALDASLQCGDVLGIGDLLGGGIDLGTGF
jgi:hypothetical protein